MTAPVSFQPVPSPRSLESPSATSRVSPNTQKHYYYTAVLLLSTILLMTAPVSFQPVPSPRSLEPLLLLYNYYTTNDDAPVSFQPVPSPPSLEPPPAASRVNPNTQKHCY